MSQPVKRQYDSSRRQAQARQTRREILRAAYDLFVEQGYARTTIADIARAAGVSAETIYATFKNKASVLARVWDVTIGGDDEEIVFHERPEIQAIRAEPDLAKRFMMHARMSTAAARRMAPFTLAVRAAAGAEPSAAEMLAEMGRQRYVGMGVMAREAAATGQLAVSEQECRDIVWAMTDGMLWHQFVVERGWTDEQYADWLGRIWVATLVKPRRARRRAE
ncbi:MAG TPA: TetR family transcriptional regulator [Jatrophihabitans sp.]|nr:TetR family transcriptional regulator [Jatrophihabitans sp.]